MRGRNGWMVLKESDWKREEGKVAESLGGRRATRNSFLSLPLLLTFPRSSFFLHLRPPPLIHSRRKAKKRMYFSSIHCAVAMTTTILDNLPPPRTCPPLYQAILFLIFDETVFNFVSVKKCIQEICRK